MVSAPGVHNIDHPWPAAGAAGNVAITYYGSPSASAQLLNAYITQSKDARDAQPLFYAGVINNPDQPIYHDYGWAKTRLGSTSVGGEYDPA